ncbi:MAG: hypothetical protein A2Y10_12900 [Planctomycetes bacterium GWF2_41_51]|nr:MAG: hypothetical protein A2Y10_12900 [Planctomycetes bacterium GWF2_41_51]HBG28229.1 hypothetical protein [Phycisphaerales bacterium]
MNIKKYIFSLLNCVLIFLLSGCNCVFVKEGTKLKYTVENNWVQGYQGQWVNVTGIALDSKSNIYAAGGKDEPILVFDKNGKFINSWGKDFIKGKHGLRIYNDKAWITDIESHQVFECTLDGKVIRTFGKAFKPGLGNYEFNKPTDVAIAANGDIYITDGYGNSRIMCFDAKGNFKFSWGTNGNGSAQFLHPHNIVIDKQNRIYVADRGNFRIQVFDLNGKYITQWTNAGQPYGLFYCGDRKKEKLFVTDGNANGDHRVLVKDTNGKIISQFGHKGPEQGMFETPHSVTVDKQQNIYIAEAAGKRIQKFILAKDN